MARTDAFIEELIRVSADLDRLIADRSAGHVTHARHEQHVDQAAGLADRLRAVGRGPGRPVHPPLAVSACGSKAAW